MENILCPNFSNKDVVKAFDELKLAVGENDAYALWSLNGGNPLDRAPNGAPSILFRTYLLETNGDRLLALMLKSQVYEDLFLSWFGDWINDPENASKVVDENGEPMVVYHGTLGEFTIFDKAKLGETTGKGYYTDHITGEKIPIDSSSAFFFTDNKIAAQSYKNLSIYNQNIFRRAIYLNLASVFLNNPYLRINDNLNEEQRKEQRDFIDNILSPYMGFNVREQANKIIDGTSALSEEKKKEFGNRFKDIAYKIRGLPDSRSISNQENYIQNSKKDLEFIKANKEKLLTGKPIQYFKNKILSISSGYGRWEKGEVYINVGKDSDTDKYYVVGIPDSDGKIKPGTKDITSSNFDTIIKFWEEAIRQNKKSLEEDKKKGHYNNGNVLEVFLNIKNPLEHDYNNSSFPDDYLVNASKEDEDATYYEDDVLKKPLKINGKTVPTGYVAARQVKKAIKDNNDGVIYRNVVDPFHMSSYGIFNSNQVKSATDNNGEFSTENDDIRYNLNFQEYARYLRDYAKKEVYDHKMKLSDFNKKHGTNFKYTDEHKSNIRILEKLFKIDLNNANDLKLDTPQFTNKAMLLSFLQMKFGLNYVYVKDEEYERKLGKIGPCCVIGDTVYIKRSKAGAVTTEQFCEEFLHPMVHALYKENKELCDKLIEEAEKNFPDLVKQILFLYKHLKNANDDVINEEIITQVLSKYFTHEIAHNGLNSRKLSDYVKNLVEKILEYFKDIFSNEVNKVAVNENGDLTISGADIKDVLNYENLARLINSKHLLFKDTLSPTEVRYSLIESDSITKQMYNVAVNIETKRKEFIDKIVNSHKINNPNISDKEIIDVSNKARIEFDENQYNRLLQHHQSTLAEKFGLRLNLDGFYESYEDEPQKLILEHFINSLQESTNKIYSTLNIAKSKYQQVGNVKDARSISSVLLAALYDGDLMTYQKSIIRDYVRLFWASDLIQASLDILNDGKKTSKQLEDELVEKIAQDSNKIKKPSIKRWFSMFWDKLNVLARSIFEGHKFTKDETSRIMLAVDAAFEVGKDLENTESETLLYEREDAKTALKNGKFDIDMVSSLKLGIETRIKSQESRSNKNLKLINKLKIRLQKVNKIDENSVEDVYELLKDFLNNTESELQNTIEWININLINQDISKWDPQKINFIQQDLIGYYRTTLNVINSLFAKNESVLNMFNKIKTKVDQDERDLKQFTDELTTTLDKLQEKYLQDIAKPYVRKTLIDYVEENDVPHKKEFIYNMERWLEQDHNYGDLSVGEVIIGMSSRSKSPIIKIVDKIIFDIDMKTHRLVLQKGNKLMRQYHKIRPTGSQISPLNYQKRFIELDDDGVPTLYFTREINEGKFFRRKDRFEQKLRDKYNLEVDEDGNTLFPEEDYIADDSIYNQYYDELDTWISENAERRYTLDYYKKRRRHLSPTTIAALDEIQRSIDLLLQSYKDEDGNIDKSKITESDRHKLDSYRKQKRDLGSHYIFQETSEGILHVEEKTDEAFKIAEEISNWNRYVADKIKYVPDFKKYNEALNKIKKLYGENSREAINFQKYNTVTRLSKDFYELLLKTNSMKYQSEELVKLQKRYKDILNAIKEKPGINVQNLNKLGLGLTDHTGWSELQKLDQQMADIKKLLLKDIAKNQDKKAELSFFDIAKIMYVTVGDKSQQTYIDYLNNVWKSAEAGDTDLNNVFNELFTYIDEKGTRRYLKAFKYLNPLHYTVNVKGKDINCVETVPSVEYSKLDKNNSEFVNVNFNENGNSIQPKAYDKNGNRLYKSEQYEKLTDDEKEFLDILVDTMDEAYSKIPLNSKGRRYLMPQISGRTRSVIGNSLMNKDWMTALKYTGSNFGAAFAETDSDVSTNLDLPRRPDGSVVNNIPIRFIRRLENPNTISTDVVGSVIMFYEMACNYQNKSLQLPTLELIKYSIDPKQSQTIDRMLDQYDKLQNILDQRVYGKETTFSFKSDEKITKNKQRVIQTTKAFRKLASVSMLGINFGTITVGYIDAMCSVLCDSVAGKDFSGKYLTGKDLWFALKKCFEHIFGALGGLGKQVVNDKLVAMMQYNNLSKSNADIFGNSDQSKLVRFWQNSCLMGGYTLSDYLVNGLVLASMYHHFRLIPSPEDPSKKVFMSRTDAINKYTKLGFTEKFATEQWDKSKTTLWDAYDCKDGLLTLNKEYKNIVSKKLEDLIASRASDRTHMYNGVIPISERAKLQQNVFGSFLTLMRNFYVNTYWDRFNTQADFVTEDGDHHITWQSEYKRDDLGGWNFRTGEESGAVFKDFIRGMYKLTKNTKNIVTNKEFEKLNNNQKYAVYRSISELAVVAASMFVMLWSVAFARTNNYDDDKENAWMIEFFGENKGIHINTNNMGDKFKDWMRWELAKISTRTFTERLTSWWAPTVMELLTSPSTAKSYLDDIGVIWELGMDLFGQHYDETIKTGAFKGNTKGTRAIFTLLSPLGLKNLNKEFHTNGVKSTFNYYRKLSPTNAIVPSQEEFDNKNKQIEGLGYDFDSNSSAYNADEYAY